MATPRLGHHSKAEGRSMPTADEAIAIVPRIASLLDGYADIQLAFFANAYLQQQDPTTREIMIRTLLSNSSHIKDNEEDAMKLRGILNYHEAHAGVDYDAGDVCDHAVHCAGVLCKGDEEMLENDSVIQYLTGSFLYCAWSLKATRHGKDSLIATDYMNWLAENEAFSRLTIILLMAELTVFTGQFADMDVSDITNSVVYKILKEHTLENH